MGKLKKFVNKDIINRSKIRKLKKRKIAYQATLDLKSGKNSKCLWKKPIALD